MKISGLSNSLNNALQSLRNVNAQINETSRRITTGQRYSYGPNYTLSKANLLQAQDYETFNRNLSSGLSTVNVAVEGLESINDLLVQARSLAITANSTANAADRASLSTQFDQVLNQVTRLANDTSYQVNNLIGSGSSNLTVNLNNSSTLTINASNNTASGLAISNAVSGWSNFSDIANALNQVEAAQRTVNSRMAVLGSNYDILKTRETFNNSIKDAYISASEKINGIDLETESATMIMLQTQQKLIIQAIKINNQNQRNVLNLFT